MLLELALTAKPVCADVSGNKEGKRLTKTHILPSINLTNMLIVTVGENDILNVIKSSIGQFAMRC